jgi:hypothetical protein
VRAVLQGIGNRVEVQDRPAHDAERRSLKGNDKQVQEMLRGYSLKPD